MNGKININFFSETIDEYNFLVNKFKELNVKNVDFNLFPFQKFFINDDEIIIVKLSNTETEILKKLSEKGKNIKNQIIFVLNENNALTASYLAKIGFVNIFVLPHLMIYGLKRRLLYR